MKTAVYATAVLLCLGFLAMSPAALATMDLPGTSGLQSQVGTIQKRMLNDKKIMEAILSLSDDPEIREILQDPEIQEAIQAKETDRLMTNPKFRKLMEHPKVRQILDRLQ